MRSGVRFKPPEINLSAGTSWVLRRAFGPPAQALQPGRIADTESVFELARQFSLTPRIGSKTPLAVLEEELGEDCARQFREAASRSVALSMGVESVCREIAELGGELGVPVIFLKGAALQIAGRVAPGSRDMLDVDVLVPEDGAMDLQGELVRRGNTVFDVPESDHQLQLLTHPTGLGIEVHRTILGLRIGNRGFASASQLLDGGLCGPAPGLPGGSFVPDDEVVLAHLLVHGVAQHGFAPDGYPMARMISDVQDLGVDEACLEAFLDGGFSWIAADVSRQEVEAVASLAQRLGEGEDPATAVAAGDGVGMLLRHLVAGTMDEGYAHSMKFRSLAAKPREQGRVRAMTKTLRGTLLPTRTQIDILYGSPRTELGYWGWRLWRPFDLVLRAARYGRAWLQHRLRTGKREDTT